MDAITSGLQGGCACGDVQFEIRGTPIDYVQCDCAKCRQSSNGESTFTLLVNRADFQWLSGKSQVMTLHRDEGDESEASIAVCRRCGSDLPRVHFELPVVLIPAGSLDGDPGMKPTPRRARNDFTSWLPVEASQPQQQV